MLCLSAYVLFKLFKWDRGGELPRKIIIRIKVEFDVSNLIKKEK
jgi:hypothetical protein